MNCASERFQEMIDNQKENLKYLRQLGAAAGAFEKEQYQKFTALLVDVLGEAYKDRIEEILGDRISFEALMGALQLAAVIKPSLLGVSLEKEIERLQLFFLSEKKRLDAILGHINELITKLENEWSLLDDLETLQSNYQKQLNTLYNRKIPASLRYALRAKTHLITAENMIYTGNVFEDDQSFLFRILQAEGALKSAKRELNDPEDPSIVELLIQLMVLWDLIRTELGKLTRADGPKFLDMEGRFDLVGKNFLAFLEAFRVAITHLAQAIEILDANENDIQSVWKTVHQHLILTKNFDPGTLQIAERLYQAIDVHINSGAPTPVVLDPPVVGSVVDSDSFVTWERQANIHRPFRNEWIRNYDDVIQLIMKITTNPTAESIMAVKTIYSPLTNLVIDFYRAATDGFWNRLFTAVVSINNIFARLMQGRRVSGKLTSQLFVLRTQAIGIRDGLNLVLAYFDSENPLDGLRTALGLSQTTSAIIGGFNSFFDTLGLDYLSGLIENADFQEVFGLKKEDASSAAQILKCLSQLDEAGVLAQKYGSEIRSIAAAEIKRKQKLEQTTQMLAEGAVKAEEERIAKLEELLQNFERSLEGSVL